ncbi:hypothetical protein KPL78_23405 [Roseomonas sp. HJA6]|uniref:Uncharacterized protein n=1 Tax=Roseomonas alba TaxID=2846776 RepID=A0ABS7AEU6_9PROT|nr:hypothetical protein [Neoroseomonas alba]MBW6400828.1 hypothetical protein [Neoroseomonas alba]
MVSTIRLPALRLAVLAVLLGAGAVLPARAQLPDEARCWVAIRVTGPETMRVSEREADERARIHCRQGDALVFLTDTGQPFGAFIARYCDLARSVVVERMTEEVAPSPANPGATAPLGMLTCVYRGAPRPDR